MGKFGYIGNKIVVILVSIGILFFFVYLGEVSYGDLGMIIGEDVVIVIFNLGKIEEIVNIVLLIKCKGVLFISMVGDN